MKQRSPDTDWHLFSIPTRKVLEFIENATGEPFPPAPDSDRQAQRWHLALRQGLHKPLHVDVGMPGIYLPQHPVIENACALHAALLLGLPEVPVILSGEWEEACCQGLITREQLRRHEAAFAMDMRELTAAESI